MKLGVLDYGGGNLRSVLNALTAVGAEAQLVTTPAHFAEIDVLVFPGQGAFGDSVRILKQQQLWEPLQQWLTAQKPYLGICLGYQLLFESSEESPGIRGLAVVPGQVRRFQPNSGLKVPHMGWNEVRWAAGQEKVFGTLADPTHYYFVHSFYPVVETPELALCHTEYGTAFISGIATDHLVAVQFHPEKSQEAGLKLLKQSLDHLMRARASRSTS
jgi:imidazole glycerol-phosphate synthase subunit HisH